MPNRKGRSTAMAIRRVVEIAKDEKLGGSGERWCALITVDVRNAFNAAAWGQILRILNNKGISRYLQNFVRDYFTDRQIEIEGDTYKVTSGIPQGSVLGPLLWNVFYDPVLNLAHEEGVETIGFADDLAIVTRAKNKEELIRKTNEALRKTNEWMEDNHLSLAPEKTEAVILSGRRNRTDIKFAINDTVIAPAKKVKYLGIYIGENISYGAHVTETAMKAGEKLAALTRLLPNIGGPRENKRKLLYAVVQSIILYGASIWNEALRAKKYKDILVRVQRRALLRVASGYRTTSSAALQVITGITPIDLAVIERATIENSEDRGTACIEAKEVTKREWQRRWDEETVKGQWTKRLIPNIQRWRECKYRNLDYFLTQALTGHGSFRVYTKRIGKTNEFCIYCGAEDTAEHTIFLCPRWHQSRTHAETEIGTPITPDTLIDNMTDSRRKWNILHKMIHHIMSNKEKEERQEQQREREDRHER